MNKLNKFSALALSLLMLACSKPEVEIVEQNNAYSIDPKLTHVEMPEKVSFDPSNLIRMTSSNVVPIGAMLDIKNRDRGLEVDLEKVVVEFQLKKPLKTATKVAVTENRELLKDYEGDKGERKAFPNGAITTKEFTIPTGVTSYTAELSLANIKMLADASGYLTAYSLSIVEGGDAEVALTNSSKALFVALDIEEYDSDPDMIPVVMSIVNSRERTSTYAYGGSPGLSYAFLSLDVELDKESPLPIEFRVVQDRNLLNFYNDRYKDGDSFPEWLVPKSQSFTFPAKTKKQSFRIPLSQEKHLDRNGSKGYIAAFRLEPVSFPQFVSVSQNKNRHYLTAIVY